MVFKFAILVNSRTISCSLAIKCRYFHWRTRTRFMETDLLHDKGMASSDIVNISQFNTVTEGKASVLFSKNNEVFYNPVQQFNRDMSIAAIRTWSTIFLEEMREKRAKSSKDRKLKRERDSATERDTGENESTILPQAESSTSGEGFTILEALSASGLRSIRYAKEIPNIRYIVANDLELDAVSSIRRNVSYNGLSENLVKPNHGDAIALMYLHRECGKQFDVIDIDPYGTAAPFIDGAVQAVSDGGLLCVTCTDLAILTGSMHPETCFYKYGGVPMKGMFCHESALRLVLHTLQTSAGRYQRYIVPLVTCSIDFYCRIFVRVFDSAAGAKNSGSNLCMAYHCAGCNAYASQPLMKISQSEKGDLKYIPSVGPTVNSHCEDCGNIYHIGGPMWGAAIHDKAFVEKMLNFVKDNKNNFQTSPRMIGMLTVINEELDIPFYWTLGVLTKTLHCNSIPLRELCSAILHAGYKFSMSHCNPGAVKTDAPPSVMWDIMKGWTKIYPVKIDKFGENAPVRKILSKEPSFEANFTRHPNSEPESRQIKIVRFQQNPERNWGPKARAGKPNKRKLDETSISSEYNSQQE